MRMSHAACPLGSCMRSRLSWVPFHARLHSWQRERGQSSCRASRGWAGSLASNNHLLLAWVQSCLPSLSLGTACSPWLLSRPQRRELYSLPSAPLPSCPLSPHATMRLLVSRDLKAVGEAVVRASLPHRTTFAGRLCEKDKAKSQLPPFGEWGKTDIRQPLTLKWKRYSLTLRHSDSAALARVWQRLLWADSANTAAPD